MISRFLSFMLYRLGLASKAAYPERDDEQHQGLKWHMVHLGRAIAVMLVVVVVSRALGIGLDDDASLLATVLTALSLALALYLGDLYRSRV